jgi:transposase
MQIRQLVVDLFQDGESLAQIGQQLLMAKSSVQYIVQKFKKLKLVANLPGRGRKRLTTPRQDKIIRARMLENRRKTASEMAAELRQDLSLIVSPQLIRNRLHEAGYHGRVARKKPWISPQNKKARLQWARTYQDKPQTFWNRVLWSDESKFNLFQSDGMVRVWRKPSEAYKKQCLQPTIKYGGGSVMVWGCMSAKGVGQLVFIDGIMNSEVYLTILDENLQQSAHKLGLKSKLIFQQDNDPKHTAKIITKFLQEKKVEKLPWVAQSPDLNPIEHLWDEMGRKMKEQKVQNKQELRELVVEVWKSISSSVTQKLVNSMGRRIREVIKNKGGSTRY